jgi:hypothetical protein
LQSYSTTTDPLFFTTKFIDDLRQDIKYLITVQRPKDLDTACCLALLQEENNTPQVKHYKPQKVAGTFCSVVKGAYPLPKPPVNAKNGGPSDDKTKTLATKGVSVKDKLAALSTYRMAKGLCRKCGEKRHKGHKCADSIQLNALQEI